MAYAFASNRHVQVREEWLASYSEAPREPGIPIIDTHHHFYDGWRNRFYSEDDFYRDINTGHNVVATVLVQASGFNYRKEGDPSFAPVGESDYASRVARKGEAGVFGKMRICGGIVGFAELSLGSKVRSVLEAHIEAGQGHFRGIRDPLSWDPDGSLVTEEGGSRKGRMQDTQFLEGLGQLAPLGLTFDVWVYYPQLAEVKQLARRFPDIQFVLNHFGGPIHIGPYAGKHAEQFGNWKAAMRDIADCPNVFVKLGGIGMKYCGFRLDERETPPSSQLTADTWRPHVESVIELFGTQRCMFESNYPVDKGTATYVVLVNAFKWILDGASETEKNDIFNGTASRFYKIAV